MTLPTLINTEIAKPTCSVPMSLCWSNMCLCTWFLKYLYIYIYIYIHIKHPPTNIDPENPSLTSKAVFQSNTLNMGRHVGERECEWISHKSTRSKPCFNHNQNHTPFWTLHHQGPFTAKLPRLRWVIWLVAIVGAIAMGFSAITLGFCRPRVTVNAVQFKKGLRVSLYLYVYI